MIFLIRMDASWKVVMGSKLGCVGTGLEYNLTEFDQYNFQEVKMLFHRIGKRMDGQIFVVFSKWILPCASELYNYAWQFYNLYASSLNFKREKKKHDTWYKLNPIVAKVKKLSFDKPKFSAKARKELPDARDYDYNI